MKIIVGLGNPGPRYELTRHNVGFLVVDKIAEDLNIEFTKEAHFSQVAEGRIGNEKVILLKPLTYMNLSGKAVSSIATFYKVDPADIMVIYDDMDIETGKLKIKGKGSAGGHKGIGSIMQLSGTQDIPRTKVGIGRPGKIPVTDYVLQPFSDSEWELIKPAILRAADAVEFWVKEGLMTTMNKFNSN